MERPELVIWQCNARRSDVGGAFEKPQLQLQLQL